MASQPKDPDSDNVVDLAQARKRQKTVRRAGASANKGMNGGGPGGGARPKWVTYVQVILMLVMMAYMMTLCSH